MKKRVLIVDDCAVTRAMFCQQFENLGAEVLTVSNGVSAIASVRESIDTKKDFSLLILDIRMPEMNGMVAAQKIREAGFKGVLAGCTATISGDGRREGRAAGIDVYLDKMVLKKPVFEALLNKI